MRYEFRSATGRVCCKANDPSLLCPACKARAGLTPIQRTDAPAAPEHDPLAGYRPALAAFAQETHQQLPPQQRGSSDHGSSFVPDPYQLALDRMKENRP